MSMELESFDINDVFNVIEIKFEMMEDDSEIDTNGTDSSKRKAFQDIDSFFRKNKNHKRRRVQSGLKSYEVREILKADPFKFCQDLGLVSKAVKCYCNEDMKLTFRKQSPSVDPYVWRCRKNKHNTTCSVRKNSIFENSKLSLTEVLWLMYMWVYDYSIHSMLHETDCSHQTVLEWCATCIKVCRNILESNTDPVGGKDKTVEIFECSLKEEELNDKDSEAWVFGALELNSTKSLLVIVEDKSPYTILKMLDEQVLSGSTLISYNWSAYKNLTADNLEYLKNEKSLSFYNMWTKREIETFRDFESVVKQPMMGTHFWNKAVYEESFFKKMYRRSLLNAPDAFTVFLKDVARVYKPCVQIVNSTDK